MPVRHIEIDEHAGQRLDNFLIRELGQGNVPRSRVYRMVRRGEVRVNGGRSKAHYRLAKGDVVRIPPVRVDERPESAVPLNDAQALRKAVLFEDDELIVLNKPAGVAVHGGSGISHGVIELIRALDPSTRYELAHRLDRDTSGCLVLAKTRPALLALHEAFREGAVQKRYDVVVSGEWPARVRTVRQPLHRYVLPNGERRVRVDARGERARTDFEVYRRAAGATWLRAFPRTGRTHQIRVHAAASGHPVVGDDKYGDRNARFGDGKLPSRMMLHASGLRFADGRHFEAPLDPAFDAFWRAITV